MRIPQGGGPAEPFATGVRNGTAEAASEREDESLALAAGRDTLEGLGDICDIDAIDLRACFRSGGILADGSVSPGV